MTSAEIQRTTGLAVNLRSAAGATGADDLATAIDSLDTPAQRWQRKMPGIVNPGTQTCVLEYSGDFDSTLDAAEHDLGRLGNAVDRRGSFAMAAELLIFVPCQTPAPIRYWYCMHRRHDFSHDGYLRRYQDIHSQFGIDTDGIEGYTQWHADPNTCAAVAGRLGTGRCSYDSISVLDIADLNVFFSAAMSSDIGERAKADEALFVDADKSHDHILARAAQ